MSYSLFSVFLFSSFRIFFWDFGKAAFYLIFCDTYVCADHSCIAPRKCNCFEGNRHALRRRNLPANGVLFDLLQVIDECDGERLKIWKIVIYNNLLTVLEFLKSQIFFTLHRHYINKMEYVMKIAQYIIFLINIGLIKLTSLSLLSKKLAMILSRFN